jgi:hypothetical protein
MNETIITIGQLSLCGILVALLVLLLNHILANTRDKAKEKRQIGKKVISAFSKELDALYQTDDDCRLILTTEAYKRHESAIRSFLPYLSWIDRARLKRAWHSLVFHHKDKKGNLPFYEQYADCGSLSKRHAIRPEVIRKIDKIVSFGNR